MTPDLRTRLKVALGAEGRPSSDYDLNPGVAAASAGPLTPAAVLVGVVDLPSGPVVILTKRSARLKHHPGQIAFPGGKVDPGDADAVAAALREAREEVGLPDGRAEVLGTLPPHRTVTGFSVTPVLALIDPPFDPAPEAGEVAEVFTVPLAQVTDPARFAIEWRRWRGQRRAYYVVPHGPHYIWGATARILRALADRMG